MICTTANKLILPIQLTLRRYVSVLPSCGVSLLVARAVDSRENMAGVKTADSFKPNILVDTIQAIARVQRVLLLATSQSERNTSNSADVRICTRIYLSGAFAFFAGKRL